MIPRHAIATARLVLRPSEASDAARAIEIQSNWNVTRNLRMASFPPDRPGTVAWFASHEQEWRDGTAYRFAIMRDDRMIGITDVDQITGDEGDLGYWLEESAWGSGYAFEAAQALVRFAFGTVRLTALNSGHAADNIDSGRILTKLGFVHTGDGATHSNSRGTEILQRRYRLAPTRIAWARPPHDNGGREDATMAEDGLTLTGVLTRADHETYRELPFDVPPGVTRLTVAFDHTGREQKTTVDLGLLDPDRFRGWSGGDKMEFTLAATDATPSYLPGPIVPGRWTLLLGIPNIREGREDRYTATIRFGRGERVTVSHFSNEPLVTGARWYRGDLHMHTCHSDGTVRRRSDDKRVPGPVYRTVEAAAARGADFIAVTDHNAVSHHHSLRELQPAFDKLLLIPGVEITTFHGHIGVLGAEGFVEFRLGSRHLPHVRDLQDAVARRHGLFIINHPALPSNEFCMGCGWTATGTDHERIDAVEVVNGGAMQFQGGLAEGPLSGIPFWEARLNEGHRPTAVGGSDCHKPDEDQRAPPAIGSPTTVVYADNLSERAILDAIRAGHVFVDIEGTPDRMLDFRATCNGVHAMMGDSLAVPPGAEARFTLSTRSLKGAKACLTMEGVADGGAIIIESDDEIELLNVYAGGRRLWLRVDIRDAATGKLLMIGNPIYLNSVSAPKA